VDTSGPTTTPLCYVPGIRDGVRDLLGKQMDALQCQFQEAKDKKLKDEIMLKITKQKRKGFLLSFDLPVTCSVR
jgi:hypothetical protein